jgi:hypothetical protein
VCCEYLYFPSAKSTLRESDAPCGLLICRKRFEPQDRTAELIGRGEAETASQASTSTQIS